MRTTAPSHAFRLDPVGQTSLKEEGAFSLNTLLNRVDQDRELLKELVEIFKHEFPRYRDELRQAVAQSDLQRVSTVGHALKGMFANLAADQAAALAANLERIGKGTETRCGCARGIRGGVSSAIAGARLQSRRGVPMKILIAEDDGMSRRLLQKTLENAGYEVVAVENGRLAQEELCRSDGPRLALLDWEMPEADGPTVCRAVRARTEKAYVYMILTSKESSEDKVAGLQSGADNY